MTQNFKNWVRQSQDFELFVEPPFNLVCFRHKNGNDFNMNLMNAVNDTGMAFFTHTKLNGQVVLRLSIGQTNTEAKHVKATWGLIQEIAEGLKVL
jgi:aromatic-L-amino-acid decarboxylase